ncbi:hypothetical protein AB0P15_00440 [Streptomyces sp. NPDC087917]|uniref:three-helix bundle dimerization domain-containing protein n=1 Tax=Streptomyces sp. NPDC087917 TaxID=3155060 RepID=UPI00341D8690
MESEAFLSAEPRESVGGPQDPEYGTDGLLLAPLPSDGLSRPVPRVAQAAGADGRPAEPSPGDRDERELVSVRNLVARLKAAYPLVDAATVEAVVRTAYASFDRARVRAYIPILVERRSRQALGAAGGRGAGRGPCPVTAYGSAGSVTGAGGEPDVTGGARSEAPCPPGPEKG